jgi:signal recognition particle GTPase
MRVNLDTRIKWNKMLMDEIKKIKKIIKNYQ